MVRTSVLNDCLKSMNNAEKAGKRQVMIRPSSKVIIKFLAVMQKHGMSIANLFYTHEKEEENTAIGLITRWTFRNIALLHPPFKCPKDYPAAILTHCLSLTPCLVHVYLSATSLVMQILCDNC